MQNKNIGYVTFKPSNVVQKYDVIITQKALQILTCLPSDKQNDIFVTNGHSTLLGLCPKNFSLHNWEHKDAQVIRGLTLTYVLEL